MSLENIESLFGSGNTLKEMEQTLENQNIILEANLKTMNSNLSGLESASIDLAKVMTNFKDEASVFMKMYEVYLAEQIKDDATNVMGKEAYNSLKRYCDCVEDITPTNDFQKMQKIVVTGKDDDSIDSWNSCIDTFTSIADFYNKRSQEYYQSAITYAEDKGEREYVPKIKRMMHPCNALYYIMYLEDDEADNRVYFSFAKRSITVNGELIENIPINLVFSFASCDGFKKKLQVLLTYDEAINPYSIAEEDQFVLASVGQDGSHLGPRAIDMKLWGSPDKMEGNVNVGSVTEAILITLLDVYKPGNSDAVQVFGDPRYSLSPMYVLTDADARALGTIILSGFVVNSLKDYSTYMDGTPQNLKADPPHPELVSRINNYLCDHCMINITGKSIENCEWPMLL